MLGHMSAAITLDTLDIYAELFDGDLDSVSGALDHAVVLANVPKNVPTCLIPDKRKALLLFVHKGSRAFLFGGDGAI